VLSSRQVEIISVVRRMHGGSQSFLVRGCDRRAYVATFAGNPQGNRTLINECIASHLLSVLNVATPDLAVLRLTESCEGREQLYYNTGRYEPIQNGLHLGSRAPVDPDTVPIFDFLPRNLYSRVANIHHAGIAFAFDLWVAHVDTRQFIYSKNRKGDHWPGQERESKAILTMWAIDNGRCFGANWDPLKILLYPHLPLEALKRYLPFDTYLHCVLEKPALIGVKLIQDLLTSVIHSGPLHIPRDWFSDGDEEALAVMFDVLQRRRSTLSTEIRNHLFTVTSTIGPARLP
jgi:hypothetical protein